jgi:hypothetical protein
MKNGTESEETVNYLSSPMGVCDGLFIGEVMGLITMPLIPLTTYPANRARGQGVIQSITSGNHYILHQMKCRHVSGVAWRPPILDGGDTHGS